MHVGAGAIGLNWVGFLAAKLDFWWGSQMGLGAGQLKVGKDAKEWPRRGAESSREKFLAFISVQRVEYPTVGVRRRLWATRCLRFHVYGSRFVAFPSGGRVRQWNARYH